jgi:hypothetical protein
MLHLFLNKSNRDKWYPFVHPGTRKHSGLHQNKPGICERAEMGVHAVVRPVDGLAIDGAGHLLRAASTLVCIRTEKCQELSATCGAFHVVYGRGVWLLTWAGVGEDGERRTASEAGERRVTTRDWWGGPGSPAVSMITCAADEEVVAVVALMGIGSEYELAHCVNVRDDNLGTGTWYPSGTRPDGYGYGDDFLPVGDTRTRPESRRVFFPTRG